MTTIQKTCRVCKKPQTIVVADTYAYERWRAGHGYVQDIPGLTPDEREMLLSGCCGPCFDSMFPEED